MASVQPALCGRTARPRRDRPVRELRQGEQDNDPANVTDCRLGSPSGGFVPRGTEVRAAELQVFSSNPSVSGAELADDGHDDD
jgi:hypothetical protein